jgi:outer membrane receptor for ferrienterochelin and colicins
MMRFLFIGCWLLLLNTEPAFPSSPTLVHTPIANDTLQLKVAGACGMCKSRIEKTALANGATYAHWDGKTQKLSYIASSTHQRDNLINALVEVGHDTEGKRAPQAQYDALPGCCHYTRMEVDEPKTSKQEIQLKVAGICGMCKTRIEKQAQSPGLESAHYHIASQTLTLLYDPSTYSLQEAQIRIIASGHAVGDTPGNSEAYALLPACCKYLDPSNPHLSSLQSSGDEVSFSVAGVCGMCKTRIEKTVEAPGLTYKEWDQQTGILHLRYNPEIYSVEKAKKALLDVGHDVEGNNANQRAYRQLPTCCLYKDPNNPHVSAKMQVIGVVLQEDHKGQLNPLQYTTVFWLEDPQNSVSTDSTGVFKIPYKEGMHQLIVSFAGYQSDTLEITDPKQAVMITAKNQQLQAVHISNRRSSTYISALQPARLEILTSQELYKAACCDLSESFETNASIDVVSNDAVTGSKQIQMLGLSGQYTQILVENLPAIKGFSAPLGLNSIAGTWIDAIQISKGIGSVVNGFENMTGQINVELKKPEGPEVLLANAYINTMGRSDVNLNVSHRINDRWATSLLLHDNFNKNKHMNVSNNGFRDAPTGNLFSGIHRWRYENGQGWMAQFGIKYLSDQRTGGQIDFDPARDRLTTNAYGLGFQINRYEAFAKIGYLFPGHTHRSIGVQLNGSLFDQNAYFGLTTYQNEQKSGYINLLYQDVLGSVAHKYRIGISTQYDAYDERLALTAYLRTEVVPGTFAEYTFSPNEKFDAVLGMRGDYNSIYGWSVSPRIHVRYSVTPHASIRISGGKGLRTANIFSENTSALVSARTIHIQSDPSSKGAYGLEQEVVWNAGISWDQHLRIGNRDGHFSLEYFRNQFTSQVVVDREDPRKLVFYNLDGRSFANSLQAEWKMNVLEGLDLRLAYRLFDVQTTYEQSLKAIPLVAKHRGFFNLGYQLPHGWALDYTLNWVGQKRLPSTQSNPEAYRLADHSSDYFTMNAQISKRIGKKYPVDVYVGGENLGHFYQKQPVLGADDPFGAYFDTALLWGPLTGRMGYLGIRFFIQKP